MLDVNVAAILTQGGVGVIPTDTVYGLACCATDGIAVGRLYSLKGRENKPGTVIASSIDQLVNLGIKRRYLKAVEQYWPNPISIVIPCGPELTHIHLGLHSIAMRVSNDETLNKLLEETGPLLTTSANLPGQPQALSIEQARQYFGDKVDIYVDGGDLSGRKSSTVIRIIDDAVEVLRQGALKVNEKGEIET